MKILKNRKKAAAAVMSAIMLTGALTVPVMAHGHGSNHNGSYSGTYCTYHGTVHNNKSNCGKYCTVHGKTHAKGKIHH